MVFQMRKFVAQYSAGLRVRLNPSLQSEQVGIIKPNGIISFIDEVNCIEQPSHSKTPVCVSRVEVRGDPKFVEGANLQL